jgi:hypothetical protein
LLLLIRKEGISVYYSGVKVKSQSGVDIWGLKRGKYHMELLR